MSQSVTKMSTIQTFFAPRALKTANAKAASDGFGAEHLFCNQDNIKLKLEEHFKRKIKSHQTNRRPLAGLPAAWQGIASHVCLAQPKSRGRMKGVARQEFLTPCVTPSVEDSKGLARLVLLGSDPAWAPHLLILTWTNGGVITKFSIKPMDEYLACVDAAMYPTPEIRPTTVSICPEIAMQRKGGDKGGASADDLQFKLNFSKDVMDRQKFEIVNLA